MPDSRRPAPRPSGEPLALPGIQPLSTPEFEALRDLIHARCGIVLRAGKEQLVASRLARRLRALGLTSYGAYLDHLRACDPEGAEGREMVNAITTNKTDFFREPHHFEFLERTAFPELIASQRRTNSERVVRAWSAGCSTGAEPYTLAMLLHGAFPATGWDFRILATDIDTQVLATAARGVYEAEQIAPVPPALQQRYFRRGTGAHAGKVRVVEELRSRVHFQPLNFADATWPVQGPFDLVLCRNVMIYFGASLQRRIVERFASLLPAERWLFIGHSESLHGLAHLFEPLRGTVYRRVGGAPATPRGQREAAPAMRTPPVEPAPGPGLGARARLTLPAKVAAAHARAAASGPDARLLPRRNLIIGAVEASREPVRMRTVLGSCVCACIHDPFARVGGINHFMLPDPQGDDGIPARYGVHAMEMLINEVLKRGGDRRRLVAKAFGAAHVLTGVGLSPEVPRKNAAFVKRFLEAEGIPLLSSRLGGPHPVEVVFTTDTGRAMVRSLAEGVARDLAEQETRYDLEIRRLLADPVAQAVEIFQGE
jgi:chemotaxis protein methyltransferase CheR